MSCCADAASAHLCARTQDLLEHLRPSLVRHAAFEEAAAEVAALEAADAAAAAAGLPMQDSDSDDESRKHADSDAEGARQRPSDQAQPSIGLALEDEGVIDECDGY